MMKNLSLENACKTAAYHTQYLANAGQPTPPPEAQPDLPAPEGKVTEDHIVTIAARGQNGTKYLTATQRKRLFRQLIESDVPGKATLHLNHVDDVWLCRMLLNAQSVEFVQKAFGRPFTGSPILAKRLK